MRPSRGTEVLELPADLEWEEPDKNGVMRYGWRYYSGKGYEGEVKWVQAEMVPIAKLAVRRILALTKEARALALWIEKNPGHVSIDTRIAQTCQMINRYITNRWLLLWDSPAGDFALLAFLLSLAPTR